MAGTRLSAIVAMGPWKRQVKTAVVCLAASTLTLAEAGESAETMLKRSMSRSFNVNVVSIMLQRDPSGDGTYQRIKQERSSDGKSHHMVLQPLRMYGVESVDNGKRNLIYLPDEKLLIDQPSPASDGNDTNFRFQLVKRNYRISQTGTTQIAGRTAAVVLVKSKYPDLPDRRFFIDKTTYYPLRMESIDEAGGVTVYYDTKDIKYPKTLDADLFKMRPLGRVGRVRYDKPETFRNASVANAALGFKPVLPKDLPYGFKVQTMENTQDPNWRALKVHMTDGLVKATLYQWSSSGGSPNVRAFMDRSMREVGGVKLLLVSELPSASRERLLAAFAAHLQANPEYLNLCALEPSKPLGPP